MNVAPLPNPKVDEILAQACALIDKAETPEHLRRQEFYGRGRLHQAWLDDKCTFLEQERAGNSLTSHANDVERALKARIEHAMRGQAVTP